MELLADPGTPIEEKESEQLHGVIERVTSNGPLTTYVPLGETNENDQLFVILGNIGCGKTTMIEMISNGGAKGHHVIPEPVSTWISCGFLQKFYEDMTKYALPFQMFAFATRAELYKFVDWNPFETYFADAHIISDRYVFAESLMASGFISQEEMKCYDVMFESWRKIVPEMNPKAFIYLRTKPETCKRRISERGRKEEENIAIEYLEKLHDRFEALSHMEQFKNKMHIVDVDECDQTEVYSRIMGIVSTL